MSTTITLPTGDKVRLASQRRYVVVRSRTVVRHGVGTARWVPVYRTDVLARAKGRASYADYIVDQDERRVIWPVAS